jgi:hypothetical protein
MAGQQPGHYATVSYYFLQTGSREVDGRDICGKGARKTRFALLPAMTIRKRWCQRPQLHRFSF